LPEGGTIKVEEFAHAALGGFDFVVYLVSGKIDEECRNFGQQPFERQQLVKFFMRFDS
jgi:hypothetical protein